MIYVYSQTLETFLDYIYDLDSAQYTYCEESLDCLIYTFKDKVKGITSSSFFIDIPQGYEFREEKGQRGSKEDRVPEEMGRARDASSYASIRPMGTRSRSNKCDSKVPRKRKSSTNISKISAREARAIRLRDLPRDLPASRDQTGVLPKLEE